MTCTFRLVKVDGAPADPPSLTTVAPKWEPGGHGPAGPTDAARDRRPLRRRPTGGPDRRGHVRLSVSSSVRLAALPGLYTEIVDLLRRLARPMKDETPP
jgi:hypothetical protein